MGRNKSKLQIAKQLEIELSDLKKRKLENSDIFKKKSDLYDDIISNLPKFRPQVWRNK